MHDARSRCFGTASTGDCRRETRRYRQLKLIAAFAGRQSSAASAIKHARAIGHLFHAPEIDTISRQRPVAALLRDGVADDASAASAGARRAIIRPFYRAHEMLILS